MGVTTLEIVILQELSTSRDGLSANFLNLSANEGWLSFCRQIEHGKSL